MEELLSLAKKAAEEAEVFLVSFEEMPVVFEANRLKQLQTRQGVSVALRIVHHGRIGFSTATRLEDRASLVERAVAVSQFGTPSRFELPEPQPYPKVEIYDPGVEAYTAKQMVNLGEDLILRVREHTPDILCEATIARSIVSVRILNSRGGRAEFRRSSFVISLWCNLIRDTDMLFVGDAESSCRPIDDVGRVASSVINQLELAKRRASVSSGRLPVIFTPHGVVSAFIAPLAVAFNGKMVLQGASPLVNRRGEKIFDEKLSLKDDATVVHRPASRPCDDEGVPSQKTFLITNGVVGDFLYDLQTAGLAGVQSTGSGDRNGGTRLPGPSVSSLVFELGQVSFEDMLRDMGEGLVVEQLMGAAQTNVLGGEFSGNVLLGYKVERGEIVGRVKDTVVSGNVYQVLSNLAGIGREARWVGSVFTPAFYCSDLTIGSKG
ncbi:MAG: TldD/PmbA family protein [Chloroflexi bacterium]|nr:TldD/PmbA family protein [Chloroflexota bacterium]